MSLKVSCEACGKKFQGGDNLAGKTVKCPNCGSPIHVPVSAAESAAPSIADLLDDEPQLAPPEEAAAPTVAQGPKCRQCGDELPAGTRYCVVCGYNNFDAHAGVGQVALEFDQRLQRLEEQSRPRHWLSMALTRWFFWR